MSLRPAPTPKIRLEIPDCPQTHSAIQKKLRFLKYSNIPVSFFHYFIFLCVCVVFLVGFFWVFCGSFFFFFLSFCHVLLMMTLPLRGRISLAELKSPFACSSPTPLLQLLHCSLWMNSCSALPNHLSYPSLKACVLSLHPVSSGCLFDLSSCLLPARPNTSSVTHCCFLHCFFIPGRWCAVSGLTSSPSHCGSFGPFLVLACW